MATKLLKLTTLIAGIAQLLPGCGGGGSTSTGAQGAKLLEFGGVREVTPNTDGTWTVFWQPTVGLSDVSYRVFQRKASEAFDFTKPVSTPPTSSYITPDLRLVGDTCFVVRFTQKDNDSDKNVKEICTGHQPYKFAGLSELKSLRDGTYMLKWAAPPFKGARFKVMQRGDPAEPWKALRETEDNFFKTSEIGLDQRTCFIVRYMIDNFPADTNETSLCTATGEAVEFSGVTALASPANGELLVQWTASDREDIAGYHIYLGSEFKPETRIGEVKDRAVGEFKISDLEHAVVYTVGVRAFDKYGREDQNVTVMSFELKNHVTEVASLVLDVVKTDQNGKPTEVTCTATYTDVDDWQTLSPRLWFRNSKRENLGVVERAVLVGTAAQKTFTYNLVEDDSRDDELFCELQVNDGFDDTPVFKSALYKIPDTPVVATGLALTTLENTVVDISITRGEGLGYLDADRDNAREIIFSTTQGEIVSDPPFVCIDGTCAGRFKPTKDFFTNGDAARPEYATVSYQVVAGNSTSNVAMIQIAVQPVPRALGFDMIAQQDEDRPASIGKAIEFDGDKVKTFAGYTHVLNKNATMLYVRQPLYEQDFHGKIQLAAGMSPDPARGVGCKEVFVDGWVAKGFECGIPCVDGKCPFIFRADDGYYGQASFDYAVVADGIQSNYASARITVMPNLRAIGFAGLTVQGQNYKVTMSEDVGYKGARNGIVITRIDVVTTDNIQSISAFAETTPGEWTATVVGLAGYKGTGEFEYQIRATKDGRPIESNKGKATVRWYPLPVATNVAVQAIQDTQRAVSIKFGDAGSTVGYIHDDNAKASVAKIEAIDTARGYIVGFGPTVVSGDVPCDNGDCAFDFLGIAGYYDPQNAGSNLKMSFKVLVSVPSDLITNPTIYLDDFLKVPANRVLTSNLANLEVQIRPLPVATDLTYAVREFSATRPSSLAIVLDKGGATPQYSHPFSLKAITAAAVANPSSGNLSLFACAVDGICTATYTPAVGQVGELTPDLAWNLTVLDPVYLLSSSRITSKNKKIAIDVRPVPKTPGFTKAVAENTSFAPSSYLFSVSPGNGYTHADSLLANDMNMVEKGASHGSLSAIACAAGACTTTYTPTVDYFGRQKFDYRVWVTDAKLGPLDSEYGEIGLDVRPRPRAKNVGVEADLTTWQRVDENTPKNFVLELADEYTHAYSTPAKTVEVMSYSPISGAAPTTSCDAAGRCTVIYTPPTNFEGPAWIEYRVITRDTVLQADLASNTAKIFIDVYPAPRSTDRRAYMLSEQPGTVRLELKTGLVLNEDTQPERRLRMGYAHRRDHKATAVTPTALTRGTLGAFACGSDGVCTASYDTPAYLAATIDEFQYKVTVGGLASPANGRFQIEVRPTAIAQNFNKYTIENQPLTVNFNPGVGQGYTHPSNKPATRIEVVSFAKGTAVFEDIGPGAATCTDPGGTCRIIFTPDLDYWTPDAAPTEAHFTYKIWTYDTELGTEVNSKVARVNVNVRPRPRATGISFAAVQGTQPPVTFTSGAGNGYTYAQPTGTRIDRIKIVGTVQNGTVTPLEYFCPAGACDTATFLPASLGNGDYYYGNLAKFDYTVVAYDPIVQGDIESTVGTVSIDFRPKPKAQDLTIPQWQQTDKEIVLKPGVGYEHPYYASDATLYRPSGVVIVTPTLPAQGEVLAPLFGCEAASPHRCTATFRPNPSYYYKPVDGFAKITYQITVNDPVLGIIPSDPKIISIEVRPIIVNVGKSDMGVQTVPKVVRIAPGEGYTYPNALALAPQVIVVGTPFRGNVASGGITCAPTSGVCNGTFNPQDATITHLTSFDYKLVLFDNDLGPKESEIKTYTVDFYPVPHALSFLKAQDKHFKGNEGISQAVKILPGDWPTGAFCFPALHGAIGVDAGFQHEDCDLSAQVEVLNQANGSFQALSELPYDIGSKWWAATFDPASPAGAWPGFGIASFQYRVKLTPAALSAVTLSTAETDALTSNLGTAEIEFYPRPYATAVSLKAQNPAWDYVYAVQGNQLPFAIERCDTPASTPATCFKGYVQGYNEAADAVETRLLSNVSLLGVSCDAIGKCSTTVQPSSGFFTSTTDYGSFDYRVRVKNIWSEWATQKVNVYPSPVAQARSSSGIEGAEIPLTIDLGAGYTHALGAKAVKIQIIGWPSAAQGGLVDPTTPAQVLAATPANIEKAFTCDPAGLCTATYRPAAGSDQDNFIYFKVQVAAPAGMPAAQASQLLTESVRYDMRVFPKPRVQAREVVAVEGEGTPFEVALDKGYTHATFQLATKLHFMNGDRDALSRIAVRNGDVRGYITGSIACNSGDQDCYLGCALGSCSGIFTSAVGVYSNTLGQPPVSCSVGGANCPDVDFKVTVHDTLGTNLDAIADIAQPIRFNVRPKPTVPAAPIVMIQAEGEPLALSFAKPVHYGHPFYNAKSVTNIIASRGGLQGGAFACNTGAGTCTATFEPTATWEPASGDEFATIDYKVVVEDPTNKTAGSGTVGDLKSTAAGRVKIEYRPKPRATGTSFAMAEDEASPSLRTVSIGPGAGYTHTYSLKATKIEVLKGASLQRLSIVGGTCTVASCEIACDTNGICPVEIVPETDYYGPAQFTYHITVVDTAFATPRELKTVVVGTASVDVRPLPVAHDLTFKTKENTAVTLTLANAAGQGYQHPVSNYPAKAVQILSGPSNGSFGTAITCVTDSGSADFRKCIGTFQPTAEAFGTSLTSYTLSVRDTVLNRDLWSDPKSITVRIRPVPDATGFASTWTTKENFARVLDLQLGALESDKLGYWYPNLVAAEYDIHPQSIDLTQAPATSRGAFAVGGFSCTTGSDSPKRCFSTFTPAANQFGLTDFKYKVLVNDGDLGPLASNEATINLEVRPIVRAFDVSYTSNPIFRTVEDQALTWKVANGATSGYTYPTDAAYSSPMSSLNIATFDRVTDGHGTVAAGAICATEACGLGCTTSVCTGVFNPEPGYFTTGIADEAKFDFQVAVSDSTLPPAIQLITSARKTASVDVYPKPVANSFTRYTIEGEARSVTVKRGAASGFTHPRDDDPIGIEITSTGNIDTSVALNFTCTGDACTTTVTPASGFSSNSALPAAAAFFEFKPTVREIGVSPRSAQANVAARASLTVYPKPVPSDSGKKNLIIFEGEQASVTLTQGTGTGYTHKWTDPATAIDVTTVTAGSAITTPYTCDTGGVCTATFRAKDGGPYGADQASFDYKVQTKFTSPATSESASTTTEVWSGTTQGRVTFNVRATPKVPAVTQYNTFVENEPINGITIQLGAGYTYGDSANRKAAKIIFRAPASSHMTCDGGCGELICDGNGICPTPTFIPETDFHRSLTTTDGGVAKIEYQVMVLDGPAGNVEKWSTPSTMEFRLLPKARGVTFSADPDGIETTPYAMSIGRSTLGGYTHAEVGGNATQIRVLSSTNLSTPAVGDTACTGGACPLTLTPIATAFADVVGKTTNAGKTFGWAEVTYQVLVPVDTVNPVATINIWSTPATAYVYYYPKPRAAAKLDIVAIENTDKSVRLALNTGLTHDLDRAPASIIFTNGGGDGASRVFTNKASPFGGIVGQGSSAVACVGDDCTLSCVAGSCDGTFVGATDHYSTTSAVDNGCDAGGTNCPTINYKVSIQTPESGIAVSDSTGTLKVNVRKRPRANTAVINMMAAEGEDHTVVLRRGANATDKEYWHPYYDGKSIRLASETHGLTTAFVCASGGDCTATFDPTNSFAPTAADHDAVLSYFVTVNDPTKANPGVNNDIVGDLEAPTSGTVKIEYRPKPKTTSFLGAVKQNVTVAKDFIIARGDGYTHTYDHNAKKIVIVGGSWQLSKLESIGSCSQATDCVISCAVNGQCTVPVKPANGYSGDATFQYNIVTEDAAFSPTPRELTSPTAGTATIKVRPLPVANALSAAFAENTDYSAKIHLVGVPVGYARALAAADNDFGKGAVSITVTGETAGTIFGAPSCDITVGSPTYGTCTVVFRPTTDYHGAASFDFKVTIDDSYLGESIVSNLATFTLDVRPIPIANGLAATWAIRENDAGQTLSISRGTSLGDLKGYYLDNSYDVHPQSIVLDSPALDSNLGALSGFGCTTTGGTKKCDATFVPVANQIGTSSFGYKVRVVDQVMGTPFTSNVDTIDVAVRPVPVGQDLSHATNRHFKAIEGTDLDWQIANGADQGYTFPASYATVLATAASAPNGILTTDVGGGNGVILPSPAPTCDASGLCVGKFRPDTGFRDGTATFKFKMRLTDTLLPVAQTGNQYVETALKTVTVDVYPKPDATNTTWYTVQDTAKSIRIERGIEGGANLGFTHKRGHSPNRIVIQAQSGLTSVATTDFTCPAGSAYCDAAISPSAGTSSPPGARTDPTLGAYFTFKPEVKEPGSDPRIVQSENVGRANVVVYPKPVASYGTTEKVVVEGEPTAVNLAIGANLGYTHAWSDPLEGVDATPSTSSSVGSWTCDASGCNAMFTPKIGASSAEYGAYSTRSAANQVFLEYSVRTNYAALSPSSVSSGGTARVRYNLRAKPVVPATQTVTQVENANNAEYFTFTVQRNNGFTYQDDTWFGNAAADVYVRYQNPEHVSCYAGGVTTDCNPTPVDGVQCPSKICTVRIKPEANYNRQTDAEEASIQYAIGVNDTSFTGGKIVWSNWSTVTFDLIPQPLNPSASEARVIRYDGVEGTLYPFIASLGNGYTHAENTKATTIYFKKNNVSGYVNNANLDGPTIENDATLCDSSTGNCRIDLSPISTGSFLASDYGPGGSPGTNQRWGWARFKYQIEHFIETKTVKPPTSQLYGIGYVYFRPLPKPDNISFGNAIENETYTFQVRNRVSGLCPAGAVTQCGYVFPNNEANVHGTQHYADTIAVENISGGASLAEPPTCNSGTGVCTVKLLSTTAQVVTFTTKVTVNGVTQDTASSGSVTFVPRHRTQNLTASTTEGTAINIVISRGAGLGYTHQDDHDAGSVVITNISNALSDTVKYRTSIGGSDLSCTVAGTELHCPCSSGDCIIRFTPRAWADGEGNLSGGFTFRTRDLSYVEADGITPLAAMNASTVTITMTPRVLANSRNYPAGANEGEEDVVKVVSIASGTGGTSVGGFEHTLGHTISQYKVASVNNATIAGSGTWQSCVANVCDVNVTPLSGGSFATNASFTYHVRDVNNFESHILGTSAVYFYPRAKATTKTAVVEAGPAGSPVTTAVSVSLNSGYTHLLSDPGSFWARPGSLTLTPDGTLSGWSCTGSGVCSANFTPNDGFFTTDPTSYTQFDYVVATTAAHGTVWSTTPVGVYNLDVFPRPIRTAATRELRWVEGIGDVTKPAGEQMRIVVKKGIDYTHSRAGTHANPAKILVVSQTGGSFSSNFSCAGDNCYADFVPDSNNVSGDNTTAAATFKLKTVVGDAVKYLPFPSEETTYSIIIMPRTVAKPFTLNTVQGRTVPLKFANTAVPAQVEFDAYDAPWGLLPELTTDIEITQQPNKAGVPWGTITVTGCATGICSASFAPAKLVYTGDSTFKYRVRVTHSSDSTHFTSVSDEATGTVSQVFEHALTGRAFDKQQVLVNGVLIPVTDVPLRIELGNGYTQADNPQVATLQDLLIVTPAGNFSSKGSIVDQSISAGVWTGTFRTTSYWYGDVDLQYQVCRTLNGGCGAVDDVKSDLLTNTSTWMRIHVEPNDNPPDPCDKTLIVFKNQPKPTSMARDNISCGNGKWYKDTNDDDVVELRFLNASNALVSGTFSGVSVANGGDNTICAVSAPDVVCTCGTAACKWTWTPPVDVVNDTRLISWKLKTHSNVINTNTLSTDTGVITFDIKEALAPVADAITQTMLEDTTATIVLQPSDGYRTATQINASYVSDPDGYPMRATDVEVISFDAAMFQVAAQTGCDPAGVCNVNVTPTFDKAGQGIITYRVKANGLWSANKTMTLTYTAVDDAPQVFGDNAQTLMLNRQYLFVAHPDALLSTGTFYANGVGTPMNIVLKPYINAAAANNPRRGNLDSNPGWWEHWRFGYYDVDDDKAVKVRIDPATLVGGTLNYASGKDANDAFECDPSGACTLNFTPNGTKVNDVATVKYKVTTDNGGVLKEQPLWSTLSIYISSGDSTPFVNEHLPVHGTQDPDVTVANYETDFTLGRNATKNFILKPGIAPIDPDDAFAVNHWAPSGWPYPGSDLATSIEIGDGTNGAPAPTGGTLDGPMVCSSGFCQGGFKSATTYPSYPASAGFWYRVVSAENLTYSTPQGTHFFNNELVTKSDWKKITFKVSLNGGGQGCLLSGELEPHVFLNSNADQGSTFSTTIGAVGANGNHYNYPASGAERRPLSSITVVDAYGSTISTPVCVNGVCTFDWSLPGFATPTDFNDDQLSYASVLLRGYDDLGCATNTQTFFTRIIPKVATRNICPHEPLYTDPDYICIRNEKMIENVAQNSTKVISFRKRGTAPVTDYKDHEYFTPLDTATGFTANATKIKVFGFAPEALARLRSPFVSAAITGSGVTCSGTTSVDFACETTNCDANGTCSFDFKTTSTFDWGLVEFKWKAYVGDTYSRTYHTRGVPYPFHYDSGNRNTYIVADGLYRFWVKATPVVTSPAQFTTSVNEPITVYLGRENGSTVWGYTYADDANFTGKNIQIDAFNVQNGSIQESSFDQVTKILTLKIMPALNFEGSLTFDYKVSVWEVWSGTGTGTIAVSKHLLAANATRTTSENTPLNGSIVKVTDYAKHGTHIYDEATQLQIVNDDLTPVPAAKGTVAIGSCTTGTCTFTYTPPTPVYVGTVALKYRLKAGPAGAPTWSNYANLTIDVVPVPTPPVVYNLSFIGSDETAKLIAISKGATTGYTDVNATDLATELQVSGAVNGTLSPDSPIECDTAGICLVSFLPNAQHYGNATFNFNVKTAGQTATTPATVTVDFKPKLRSQSFTVNGSLNQPKPLTVARGAGYTYNPGPNVDKLLIQSLENGTIAGNPTEIACSSGACDFTVTPNNGFTGNAKVHYKTRISGTPNVDSNAAIITINIAASDEAPVATSFPVVMPDRTPIVVALALGTDYTDRENDKATALTVVGTPSGGTITTGPTCSATTGICSFTFTPTVGYSGQGRVVYTVTTNATTPKVSNQGTISFSIPDDTSRSFGLAWLAPTLSSQCKVVLPGSITIRTGSSNCGAGACTTATGVLGTGVTSLAVTADYDSVDGQLNIFTNLGTHLTSWEVGSATETAKIGRFLELKDLGAPTNLRRPIPALVPTPEASMAGAQMAFDGCLGTSCSSAKMASVSAGDGFSCALQLDGRVSCWGANDFGKLGRNVLHSTTASASDPQAIRDPSDFDSELFGLVAVAAGKNHACALTSAKKVVCWGSNEFGQLGANREMGAGASLRYPAFVRKPIPEQAANLSNIVAIATGDDHTCAVDTTRKVFCWGRNDNGQLGDGLTVHTALPRPVKVVTAKDASDNVDTTADLTDAFSIAAGSAHTCALRVSISGANVTGQSLLCWGANDMDQVGDNNYYHNDATLLTRVAPGAANLVRLFPVLVRDVSNAAIANAVGLAAGGKTSCAVFADGTAMCWGSNADGVAAVNAPLTYTQIKNPTTVQNVGGTGSLGSVVSISVGGGHACALLATKKLACWGANASSQLGNDDTAASSVPVMALDTGPAQLSNVYAVAAGKNHACVVVPEGVRCFGSNATKQIGVDAVGLTALHAANPAGPIGSPLEPSLRTCSKKYDFTVP